MPGQVNKIGTRMGKSYLTFVQPFMLLHQADILVAVL